MRSNKHMKTERVIVLITLFSITLTVNGIAADSELERATLKGISGVYVLIDEIGPDAQEEGLTRSLLQTDVETQLRKADIRILKREKSLKPPGIPYLYVYVSAMNGKVIGLYAINIHVGLKQLIYLMRDPSIIIPVETWSVEWVGMVDFKQMKESVQEQLRDLVGKFINAYLAVNPKEGRRDNLQN